MTLDYHTETLRVAPPRAARFLARSLVLAPEACGYVPDDARLRADLHAAHSGRSAGWPVPLTRVGQPAGRFGDTTLVRLQVAR